MAAHNIDQGKICASRSKIDPNIDPFRHMDMRLLAILVVQKIVFWTFSKLLLSCLGSVRALLSALKELLLGVFSALKLDK